MSRRQDYYYGSYGLQRGYGPLCRSMREADESVYHDIREEREHGRNSDRCVVLVSRVTGLCWWIDDVEIVIGDLAPVRMYDGKQAQYTLEVIREHERLWGRVEDQAGLG